jgi:hypothetical protein
MSVPDHQSIAGLDEAETAAIRRAFPLIMEWLNGHPNWPHRQILTIPVIRGDVMSRSFSKIDLYRAHHQAPAPWAIRSYRYIWPIAMCLGTVVAEGEPYPVYDDRWRLAEAGIFK